MTHRLTFEMDDFGWEILKEEAERQGTSLEAIVQHALAYYIADLDSGRIASRVLPLGEREEPGQEKPGGGRFQRD